MAELEIDGQTVRADEKDSVLAAALAAGIAVPHFCYHKKLSLSATCRMCLVDVEGAPRPVAACATPVRDGMKVKTHTPEIDAVRAGIIEFLLSGHPLECPVCDKGGECTLQDLSNAYGPKTAVTESESRVTFAVDAGPLISMASMGRCIACTRCLRFGAEVAGMSELGVFKRGSLSSYGTYGKEWVFSEVSGNLIDICPTGTITSKVSRFAARPWELTRRKAVSLLDAECSELSVESDRNGIVRIVPSGDSWISDRDRFSFEALSVNRPESPKVKQGGLWMDTDWQSALSYIAHAVRDVISRFGPSSFCAVAGPGTSLEACYLAQKMTLSLGSKSFVCAPADRTPYPAGTSPVMPVAYADIEKAPNVFVFGSRLREEAPLLAVSLRKALLNGSAVCGVGVPEDDWMMPEASVAGALESRWPALLSALVSAVAREKKIRVPWDITQICQAPNVTEKIRRYAAETAKKIAAEPGVIVLGHLAASSANAPAYRSLLMWIAQTTGSSFGELSAHAHTVGCRVNAMSPYCPPLAASDPVLASAKAILLVNAEEEDITDPVLRQAIASAETVVSVSPYDLNGTVADVMLPSLSFYEAGGSAVAMDGTLRTADAVEPAAKGNSARSDWKILRVIGNVLGLDGFEFGSREAVLAEAMAGNWQERFKNGAQGLRAFASVPENSSPVWAGYRGNVTVRRAASLQERAGREAEHFARLHEAADALKRESGEGGMP